MSVQFGLGTACAAATAAAAGLTTEDWRPEDKLPSSWWDEVKRGILPPVHGEFAGHVEELRGFAARSWSQAFCAAGFEVRGELPLPLYSGYGFGLEGLRRIGERWGLSSHTAFIVTHAGAPSGDWYWQCPRLSSGPG